MTSAGQRLIAAAKEVRAMVQDAASFPACSICTKAPKITRHATGTVSVTHMGDPRCEVVLAAYPEAKAAAMWRQHSQE